MKQNHPHRRRPAKAAVPLQWGAASIPTWGDADAAHKAGAKLTAIEHFIFDNEPVTADVWRAELRAALTETITPLQWRPIAEYQPGPYRGYDEMVLLGWWQHASTSYPAGVHHYTVGYRETLPNMSMFWHSLSDGKAWPFQPTHFALVCQAIAQPKEPKT